jgi:hypothetical protein
MFQRAPNYSTENKKKDIGIIGANAKRSKPALFFSHNKSANNNFSYDFSD